MIRIFRENDAIPLHELICDTIDVSYSGHYPARAIQFFKDYHSVSNIIERSKTGVILVCEKDGVVVATGALTGDEILGVFVRPECQGQGFGRMIMNELESRAKAHGIRETILSVSLPSRKFYESLGYAVQEECSVDVGEGQCLMYWLGKKELIQ
ncbi:GNAT family N-acetyltransferase [Candidatus Sumerlaeota bacterium]|nr:GNAT family N-acetyltransferase [Candidatus Sumerlaeota bacterium]